MNHPTTILLVIYITGLLCLLNGISSYARLVINDYTNTQIQERDRNQLGLWCGGDPNATILRNNNGLYLPDNVWYSEVLSPWDQCAINLSNSYIHINYHVDFDRDLLVEYHQKDVSCQGDAHDKFFATYPILKGHGTLKIYINDFIGANPALAHAIVLWGPIVVKTMTIEDIKPYNQIPIMENGMYKSCRVSGMVALTYEEGPDPIVTPQLLDILLKSNIKATFFMHGLAMKSNPELTKRVYNEGHHIASNSYKLTDLTRLSQYDLVYDLAATEVEIINITGGRPRYFRPPFGLINDGVMKILKNGHYRVISWNLNTHDWHREVKEDMVINAFETGLQNPHDSSYIVRQRGVDAMTINTGEQVIDIINKKQFQTVPMHECLDRRAYRPM